MKYEINYGCILLQCFRRTVDHIYMVAIAPKTLPLFEGVKVSVSPIQQTLGKGGRRIMRRFLKWAGILAIIVAIVLVFRSCGNDESVVPETAPPVDSASCQYPLNFQSVGELPELQLLPDKAGSTHAVETHADVVRGLKENPRFLAAFANRLSSSLWPNGSDWKPLASTDNKCLSDKGVEVLGKVLTIFEFQLENVDESALADRNLVNMGMTGEGLVSNSVPGIDGDRSAIVYRFENGAEVTVLKRCANLPTKAPVHPNVPPTRFNPAPAPKPVPPAPKPTTTTTVPPTTTTTVPPPPPVTVVPKVPEEDPYPQGNAPQGGGPNVDPGPGPYVPPAEMERPPETPRTNPPPPPPPAPAPSVPDEPVSTPTPTTLVTIPPVEPGAGSGDPGTPESGNGANGANDGDPGGF